MSKQKNNISFSHGYTAACANIMRTHQDQTVTRNVYECNFMSVSQLRKIGTDESDIEILKPIIKEIQRRNRNKNKIA